MIALDLLAQIAPGTAGSGGAGPPAGLFAALGIVWCMLLAMAPAQFIMAIIALVQVLQRRAPTDQKILWACVSWFIPLIGPILWWTIGSKQVGGTPRG